ncbi:MAG: hypothetical protein MZW92_74260 [Comamonadaceae bacterium]|nr:hypothetical protein [Comamonadaceae bacterium]
MLAPEFFGRGNGSNRTSHLDWLTSFATVASGKQSTLLDRYGLLGTLTSHLAKIKGQIEEELNSNSSLERYSEIEPALERKMGG